MIWNKMWIRDQAAPFVQSDLDLHIPQKLLVSSSSREELRQECRYTYKLKHVLYGRAVVWLYRRYLCVMDYDPTNYNILNITAF